MFESSEYQTFAGDALIDYVESGKADDIQSGYERLAWIHTPQDRQKPTSKLLIHRP